jgi:hypothetical protein
LLLRIDVNIGLTVLAFTKTCNMFVCHPHTYNKHASNTCPLLCQTPLFFWPLRLDGTCHGKRSANLESKTKI